MVVLLVQRVPPGLRGELTRWMLEPRAGVFVGSVSAMVRDRLWERVCRRARGGAAVLIHKTDTEQGFAVKIWGGPGRVPEDFEGLTLIGWANSSSFSSDVPTRAGVDRRSRSHTGGQSGCPHARGGGPMVRWTCRAVGEMSPRARGGIDGRPAVRQETCAHVSVSTSEGIRHQVT